MKPDGGLGLTASDAQKRATTDPQPSGSITDAMKFILAILLALLASAPAHAQSTYTAEIHNAPGWEPSTSYTYSPGPPTAPFTRVVAGAGWTPSGGMRPGAAGRGWLEALTQKIVGGSGTWNPGSPLKAYQLTSAGTCTSAPSGSGPSGTGSSIPDGTCIWKYVSGVDYVTLTGFYLDDGITWTTGTDYGFLQVLHTTDPGLPVYQLFSAGCHSTVKPTGTSTSGVLLSDGCSWGYVGKVTYASNSHPLPMERFFYDSLQGTVSGTTLTVTTPPATWPISANQYLNFPGISPVQVNFGDAGIQIVSRIDSTHWTLSRNYSSTYTGQIFLSIEGHTAEPTKKCCVIQIDRFYVANLWNDREYVSGTNGENAPIGSWNHNYMYNDAYHDLYAPPNDAWATDRYGRAGWGYPVVTKPAPGEGFQDTFNTNPNLPLAGYNANNGVAIRGVGVDGFGIMDNFQEITGLQVTTDKGWAINALARACNACIFDHNILEGASGARYVMNCGAQCYWYDNLIVAHGLVGVENDYGGWIVNNTFVCPPESTCQSAMDGTRDWITRSGTTINGNLVFGFQHLVSTNLYNNETNPTICTWDCYTAQGLSNATDVPSTDGADFANFPDTTYFVLTGSVKSYVFPFRTGSQIFNTKANRYVAACGTYVGTSDGYPVAATCTAINSLSPSSVFVAWPGNYKILSGSPVYGAGASFATWPICNGIWAGCTAQGNTPDLFGRSRPQSTRYDIGAVEFMGDVATPEARNKTRAK